MRQEESIELSFMLVGHTKFSPDRHFKKAFHVSSVAEITTVAERTSTNTPIRDASGTIYILPMECLPRQILSDYSQHHIISLFPNFIRQTWNDTCTSLF